MKSLNESIYVSVAKAIGAINENSTDEKYKAVVMKFEPDYTADELVVDGNNVSDKSNTIGYYVFDSYDDAEKYAINNELDILLLDGAEELIDFRNIDNSIDYWFSDRFKDFVKIHYENDNDEEATFSEMFEIVYGINLDDIEEVIQITRKWSDNHNGSPAYDIERLAKYIVEMAGPQTVLARFDGHEREVVIDGKKYFAYQYN